MEFLLGCNLQTQKEQVLKIKIAKPATAGKFLNCGRQEFAFSLESFSF